MLTDYEGAEKLNKVERMILEERVNGFSICTYDEKELSKEFDEIIVRLSAISGCQLPNTELFAHLLSDELKKFILRFNYSEYTLNEFMLAFQLNAYGGLKFPNGEEMEQIKFTGAFLNIDYIAKVLNNYKTVRNLLDRKLQNQIDGYEF